MSEEIDLGEDGLVLIRKVYLQLFSKLSEPSREHAVSQLLGDSDVTPYDDMCYALGRGIINQSIEDLIEKALTQTTEDEIAQNVAEGKKVKSFTCIASLEMASGEDSGFVVGETYLAVEQYSEDRDAYIDVDVPAVEGDSHHFPVGKNECSDFNTLDYFTVNWEE